tara:strand:+ start:1256 stop:1738 length:483 start_codon:yes stop_codon:yes gene_type:complete
MKFNNKFLENLSYGILIFLVCFVIIYTLNYKANLIQQLSFREKTNQNSNNLVEGFSFQQKNEKKLKDDDILVLIERKLKGLTEELGGSKGTNEIKEILKRTKKISDLECAKCMITMIDENKNIKSFDIDKLADDDESELCIKCKNYTALSSSIKNIIDSI